MKPWFATPILLLAGILVACTAPQTPAPSAVPAPLSFDDALRISAGGGEPRSRSYWLQWNSCAENNQAAIATANGGRAAGWILVDDLLADPGMLIGNLAVESCGQAINILAGFDLGGENRQADPAYDLAAQLLAAQLNLAAGAEHCAAAEQTVSASQVLLLSFGFDGTSSHLDPTEPDPEADVANTLAQHLAEYNTGRLCIP